MKLCLLFEWLCGRVCVYFFSHHDTHIHHTLLSSLIQTLTVTHIHTYIHMYNTGVLFKTPVATMTQIDVPKALQPT